jgi:hypothetical protein
LELFLIMARLIIHIERTRRQQQPQKAENIPQRLVASELGKYEMHFAFSVSAD